MTHLLLTLSTGDQIEFDHKLSFSDAVADILSKPALLFDDEAAVNTSQIAYIEHVRTKRLPIETDNRDKGSVS